MSRKQPATGGKGAPSAKHVPASVNLEEDDYSESDDDESSESGSGTPLYPRAPGHVPAAGKLPPVIKRVHPALLMQQQRLRDASSAGLIPSSAGALPSPPMIRPTNIMPLATTNPALAVASDIFQLHQSTQLRQQREMEMYNNPPMSMLQGPMITRESLLPPPGKSQKLTAGANAASNRYDDSRVFDSFAVAGLDLKSERSAMNQSMTDLMSVEARRSGLSARQVQDEQFFIRQTQLKTVLFNIVKKKGLRGVSDGVCELVSFAIQDRLENVIEQLVRISRQRVDEKKSLLPIRVISEPHQVMKRLQKAQELEKQQQDEEEKRKLLEEAKAFRECRGDEDGMDSRTVERLQRLEDEEKQKQKLTDINDAALLAVGMGSGFSFKKSSPIAPSESSHPASTAPTGPSIGQPTASFLPATTLHDEQKRQLTLQDCIFFLERDRHMAKSTLLFQQYVKLGVSQPRR